MVMKAMFSVVLVQSIWIKKDSLFLSTIAHKCSVRGSAAALPSRPARPEPARA